MGLSVHQLPTLPLLPTTPVNNNNSNSHNNNNNNIKGAVDATIFAPAKPTSIDNIKASKADSIDYLLAEMMPTGIFSSYDDPADFGDAGGVATWVPELPPSTGGAAAATAAAAVVPVTVVAPPPLSSSAAAAVVALPVPPPTLLPPPVLLSRRISSTHAAAAAAAAAAVVPASAITPEAVVTPTAATENAKSTTMVGREAGDNNTKPSRLSSVGLRTLRKKAAAAAAEATAVGRGGETLTNNNNNNKSSKTRSSPSPATAAEALDAAASTFGRVPKVSVPASAAVAVAAAAAAAAMAGAPPPSLPPPKLGKRKAVDLASIEDLHERRRERRLAKNRATAAVSRERKHAQMQALAVTVYELQREGAKLTARCSAKGAEVRALREKLAAFGDAGKEAAASVPSSDEVEEEEEMAMETTKTT